MVYCTKCGTKNAEDATVCTKCGARLKVSMEKRFERRAEEWAEEFGKRAEEWGEQFGRRTEEECFGLPHGGAIVGIIIGIIIIFVGLSWVAGFDWGRYFWPVIIVVFGILIVAGTLYSYGRRR